MFRFPDSPEGVALALAYLIDQKKKDTNEPRQDLLGLFMTCLAAVQAGSLQETIGQMLH